MSLIAFSLLLTADVLPDVQIDGTEAYSGFGVALAASNSDLFVGLPGRDPSNSGGVEHWQQTADGPSLNGVLPGTPGLGAELGSSVAALEGWVFAGAPGVQQVWVWRYDGSSWQVHTTLQPQTAGPGSVYGATLAVSDGWLVVGDPANSAGIGAVEVFAVDADSVDFVQRLASPEAIGDGFGRGLAIEGNDLFVGAPQSDAAAENGGAVYRYAFDAGTWSSASFPAPSVEAGDGYGIAIAKQGGTVWVGRYRADAFGENAGGVESFLRIGSNWLPLGLASAPVPVAGAEYGYALAVTPAWRVVGAPGESASWFESTDGTWSEPFRLPSAVGAYGGSSVALSNELVVQGAPLTGVDYRGQLVGVDLLADCDGSGSTDALEIALGLVADDDGSGVPDECELPPFDDCNGNNIPDEEEPDCDANGIPDDCDVADGAADCDANGLPDVCDPDCDADGTPDACAEDCDANGVPDACQKLSDCDGNGVPDACDPDCDTDGVPDACEDDCNTDGVPDDCQSLPDCDANGVPDTCEPSEDCNGNGLPDRCDIDDGTSADVNSNGVPDECEDTCAADITGNGEVSYLDLLEVLSAWGPCSFPSCAADIDGDGEIAYGDLLLVLSTFGPCPS